jgi:hypothetical protein
MPTWSDANRAEIRASAGPVIRKHPRRSRPATKSAGRQGGAALVPVQMPVGEGCGSMWGRKVVFSVPQSGHRQFGGMAANGVPLGMA